MREERIPPLRYLKMCILSIFGWLFVIVSTFFFGLLAVASSYFDRTGRLGHIIATRAWGRTILAMVGVRARVTGLEHLAPGESYVIVANHLSNFDILVLSAHMPLHFRWVAKKEIFQVPIMGWGMRRIGYVRVDREDKESAWASVFEAKSRVGKGTSIMFFPEGTRSPDGETKRFKVGAFVLAIQTGLPILPVALIGTRDIMRKRSLLFHPGTIEMVVLPPISPAGFTLERKQALAETIRNVITAQIEKSRDERAGARGERRTGSR